MSEVTLEPFFGCCGLQILYLNESLGLTRQGRQVLESRLIEADEDGKVPLIAVTDAQLGDEADQQDWLTPPQRNNCMRLKRVIEKYGLRRVSRHQNNNQGNWVNLYVMDIDASDTP